MDQEFKLHFMRNGESLSILNRRTNHEKWPIEKLLWHHSSVHDFFLQTSIEWDNFIEIYKCKKQKIFIAIQSRGNENPHQNRPSNNEKKGRGTFCFYVLSHPHFFPHPHLKFCCSHLGYQKTDQQPCLQLALSSPSSTWSPQLSL